MTLTPHRHNARPKKVVPKAGAQPLLFRIYYPCFLPAGIVSNAEVSEWKSFTHSNIAVFSFSRDCRIVNINSHIKGNRTLIRFVGK